MYLEHYGLREPPFSITPDPRFVFLSERHRDALAHLLFGIGQGGSGGFVQLTGEVGTGKTTLCRLLLEQLPENVRIALVLNPRLDPVELMETVCEELRIDLAGRRGSLKALVDALNHYLLDAYAEGLRVVLIIDEAQDLSVDALEQVRLLTNLETPTQKLLQVLLLGQPELRDVLARDDLRQLAQRITARYHLTPLDEAETDAYLRHRWAVAGGHGFPFTRLAVREIHARSGGVPRLVNIVAERALLGGYAQDRTQIGEKDVERAAREALAPRLSRVPKPRVATIAALAIVLIAVTLWLWPRQMPGTQAWMSIAPVLRRRSNMSAAKHWSSACASPVRRRRRRGASCWSCGRCAPTKPRSPTPPRARRCCRPGCSACADAPGSTSSRRSGGRRCCGCTAAKATHGRCCSASMRCARDCRSADAGSTSTGSRWIATGAATTRRSGAGRNSSGRRRWRATPARRSTGSTTGCATAPASRCRRPDRPCSTTAASPRCAGCRPRTDWWPTA